MGDAKGSGGYLGGLARRLVKDGLLDEVEVRLSNDPLPEVRNIKT